MELTKESAADIIKHIDENTIKLQNIIYDMKVTKEFLSQFLEE